MKGIGFPLFALTVFTACGLTLAQYKILEAVWGILLATGGGVTLGEWINYRRDQDDVDFRTEEPGLYAWETPPTFDIDIRGW